MGPATESGLKALRAACYVAPFVGPLDGPFVGPLVAPLVGPFVGLIISFLNLEINLSKSELIFNPELILFITSPSIANK